MATTMRTADLAHLLFASDLQPSDEPSPAQVRAAIATRPYRRGECTARVAQEAGDHPELYAARMRWALAAVRELSPMERHRAVPAAA